MGNEKKILESILKRVSTSAILPNTTNSVDYVNHFLVKYQVDLQNAKVIPLHISCQVASSLELWKSIAMCIQEGTNSFFDPNDLKLQVLNRKYATIQNYTEIENIRTDIVWILPKLKEVLQKDILLIFSDFDNAISIMNEFDSMKWRSLTGCAVILTFSSKTLIELGEKKYNNSYFCNQFEDPIFINP